MAKDTSDEDASGEDTSDEYAGEEGTSEVNLSVADKEKTKTTLKACPSCQKEKKNILLHIKKSKTCKVNISEEQMKILEKQSKKHRKVYQKLSMKERRRQARQLDHEKVKTDQNKWKQKSRAQANKEDEKLENKDYKNFTRNIVRVENIEEGFKSEWKVEDGTCPSCREKKKSVIQHIRKTKVCRASMKLEQLESLLKDKKSKTKMKNKRASKKFIEKKILKEAEAEKHKLNSSEPIRVYEDAKSNIDDKGKEEKKKSYETLKEKQNRWKAKSREKARQNDYAAVRKYQRESTSKWRKKQQKEDPELYKARKQMWSLQSKPTTNRNIMKVPKNLLQNYHRLNKFYDDTESEDEDQYGLTVWRQIKLLNDKNMTDEEKEVKLKSLWDQNKKKYEKDKQNETYVKEQEVKKENLRRMAILRKEIRDQKEMERRQENKKKEDLKKHMIQKEREELGLWQDGSWNWFQRINSYDVKITGKEAKQIREEGKYCLWNTFVKQRRLKNMYKYIPWYDDQSILYRMRILRKLREIGNTDKLEWSGKKCVWKWRRVDDIEDSEDSDDNEQYKKIKEIIERRYSLTKCCDYPGFHFTCLKNRKYKYSHVKEADNKTEEIREEKVKKDEGMENKVAEEESEDDDKMDQNNDKEDRNNKVCAYKMEEKERNKITNKEEFSEDESESETEERWHGGVWKTNAWYRRRLLKQGFELSDEESEEEEENEDNDGSGKSDDNCGD